MPLKKGPQNKEAKITKTRGFTFIELVIAIAISTLIMSALYFSLNSALQSWEVSQDQLLLQNVSSRLMEELSEGLPDTYGLRDTLEIAEGREHYVSAVMPWADTTHTVRAGVTTYRLDKHLKPGTALPLAEALLAGSKEWKVIPLLLVDKGKFEDYPEVRLNVELPEATALRFTFHPDYKRDSDVTTEFSYDEEEQAVFIRDTEGRRDISKNSFGVKIPEFTLRYFDSSNNEIGRGGLAESDKQLVSGIEVYFKARSKNGNTRQTLTFVSLRNAPQHSGNFPLKEGMRLQIPDSKHIKALFLANLYGIDNNDLLVLDAKPDRGRDWRLTVQFGRQVNLKAPFISYFTIEYPSGNKVYSERPRTPVDLGLNLLALGPNGLYDYLYNGQDDTVILDGRVTLEVDRMDIGSASLFVRP